jgi:hypothetical protein
MNCNKCSKPLRSNNKSGLCTKHYYEDWRSKNEKLANRRKYLKHKEKLLVSMKRYAEKNREKLKAYHAMWREMNKSYIKEQNSLYYSQNSSDYKARAGARKRRVRQATPKWLTKEQIHEIYLFYKNRPEGYHVDHIIPLNGENVSGLHIIGNLQYLPAKDNLSKSNKY